MVGTEKFCVRFVVLHKIQMVGLHAIIIFKDQSHNL